MTDDSLTNTFRIDLPQDLLMESARTPAPRHERLGVEGWRTSWLSRLLELLAGRD